MHRLKGILINRLNFTGEEEEEEEVVRIVRRRRCPRFNCRRRCEFGFQKDEFGCDKCVCNAGPRVEFPEQCADRPACYRLVNCKFSIFRVARWRRKAWCLDTRGFIPKKIQWHIHTGPWSLVNWWCKALTRHYIRGSWILMRAAVSLMAWPRPW